jgi:energy-converting hydrogenase B subunit D
VDQIATLSLVAIDGLLALAIVALAVGALSVRSLFTGVVLFIALGLLLALAWVRLHAPDLALAEAAIGAGLAGALLLAAARRLAGPAHPERIGDDEQA